MAMGAAAAAAPAVRLGLVNLGSCGLVAWLPLVVISGATLPSLARAEPGTAADPPPPAPVGGSRCARDCTAKPDSPMCPKSNDCGYPGVTEAQCMACDPKGPDPARCKRTGCCFGASVHLPDGKPNPECYFAAEP
eukprot:SAG22_NODE_7528_length_731_cov_1.113924_1_plen_134_part_10